MRFYRRWLGYAALFACAACAGPILELPPPRPVNAKPAPAPVLPEVAPELRARVFKIERDVDLLHGSEADGQKGDYRLDNGRVAFVIDAPSQALGFADSGGNLIDAVPLTGCGDGGCRDALKQMCGYLNDHFPRQPLYDRVETGEQNGFAWVRVFGHDSGAPELHVMTEYRLAPDSQALQIDTEVTNTSQNAVTGYQLGDAIQWGRAERFIPGQKSRPTRGEEVNPAGWEAGLADGVTYAYVTDDPEGLRGRHGGAWSDLSFKKFDLAPGAAMRGRRFFAVVPSAEGVGAAIARVLRQDWPRVEGRIMEESTGVPVDGAHVLLEDATGTPVAFALSGPSGYSATVPPGDYRIRAFARGRHGPANVSVSLRGHDRSKLDLLMSLAAALRFHVVEDGTPSPARLTFVPVGDTRKPHLGPAFASPGENIFLTVNGEGRVELAPGTYRVLASRGPEFTVDARELELSGGDEVDVRFELHRVIDSRGWLCADLHQHAQPSPDSGVSLADRAASNLAEGLSVMVATDHNFIADWRPVVDELHATRPLRVIIGDEATLDWLGHWNAYPLKPHPGEPRGGALDVRGLDAHQVVAGLRAADGGASRVVQVNHPRAGKMMGYFENVGLDAHAAAPPPNWEGGVDAIEVFSGKDVSQSDAPMQDWFALLNAGFAYTGVGGSDSHLIAGQEVGYPRTCVAVGEPEPADPTRAIVDGIKKRRDVFVTNGPFVKVSVAGRGMGQLAPAPRGKARLDVEVQAAPWVDARRLEVIVNGERRGKPIDLPPPAAGQPLKWKSSVELKLTEDSWVVVTVRGDQQLPILARAENAPPPVPLAFTNPIFLDRDLDGKYTPPARAKH